MRPLVNNLDLYANSVASAKHCSASAKSFRTIDPINHHQKLAYLQNQKSKYSKQSLCNLGEGSYSHYRSSLQGLKLIQNRKLVARNAHNFRSNSNSNTFWAETEQKHPHTNSLSTNYDPITGGVLGTSRGKTAEQQFARIDSVSGYKDKTRHTSPNYSPEYRAALQADPRAFNRTKGEFTYIYDISSNHKFISAPFK